MPHDTGEVIAIEYSPSAPNSCCRKFVVDMKTCRRNRRRCVEKSRCFAGITISPLMRPDNKQLFPLPVLFVVLCVAFAISATAQTLVNRYSFTDTAGSPTFADSVGGSAWNGTLVPNGGSPMLTGSSLVLDGAGDYAELPAGITSNYTQLTVEVWADFSASNPTWTRVFSFGDQNGGGGKNSGVDYCHYAGGNYQNLDMLSTNGADAYANNNQGLNGATNVHITVVVDPVNNALYYYNGTSVVSTKNNTVPPLSQINDTYNLLGRSLYDLDPTLAGTFHEFRIYNGVLPASSVALNDAAGPGTYVTSPGTITALHFSSPVNPITVNQTVQQNVSGDFTSVTNLNLVLYGGVTYFSRHNNILN